MRLWIRRNALLLVAALGLSATTWVTLEILGSARDQLQQRFRLAAHERAGLIAAAFDQPLQQFSTLQRVFHSTGKPERSAFTHFVEPIITHPGILGFGWAPLVKSVERTPFERNAGRLLGRQYEIGDFAANGARERAPERDFYFPILFGQAPRMRQDLLGLDLSGQKNKRSLVLQALREGAPVSSGVLFSPAFNPDANGKTLIFVAPVYRDGKAPAKPEDALAQTKGVLVTALDIEQLFQQSNRHPTPTLLRTTLLDAADGSLEITRWEPADMARGMLFRLDLPNSALYKDLPGWGWRVKVEPTQAWLAANAPDLGRPGLAALAGILVTLLTMFVLRRLLMQGEALREQGARERMQSEESLRLAYEAIRQSSEGILMTDSGHRIRSVNPAFEKRTGYGAAELIGETPLILASGRNDEAFYRVIYASIEKEGHWQGEIWNQRKDGEAYPEWLTISTVAAAGDRDRHYVYIYSDLSERLETQRRIEMLAHHDPLTGLPNRILLRDRVEQAVAQASRLQSRVALMFLDLDRFKTINDSLGHPAGDALLKEVVARLKRCVRESDTISRQGGDEFIIVLNDVRDSDAVSRVAEKINQHMREPFEIEGHLLTTSFSIGVAIYPDDGHNFDTLLQKADTAMYHAKEAGRNNHRFFTEQMNRQVVEHLTLETQLRRALDNGEFVLHYQPQLDLDEGTIVGIEALIRWNSPDKGLISPARFIPIAEESGLIVPIGAWVLREACRQAREWQELGIAPVVMAVNLSAVQFRHHDLINSVINALVLSDLDARWLELELTESILIQDTEATLDAVRRLKALGLKLSVDDFGTGYSSLTYLKRFAVDKLKIDQSFVRDLARDPEDAAIVRAVIQMAHSLKLRTIAEGVENIDQANILRFFHCNEAQGFWLAKPMPAHEMEHFLRSHQSKNIVGIQGSLL